MATKPQRAHLAALMDWLVEHEPLIHYPPHDVRGKLDAVTFLLLEQQIANRFGRRDGIQGDCSQTVQHICHMAGLADPCGHDYARAGFTGDLLAHLPHYDSSRAAEVGAIVVFGPGTGDHAVMVRKPGRDPIVFSHGQEAGPIFTTLSVQAAAHRAPTRFLSVAHL